MNEAVWEQTGDGQLHTSVEDLARWEENFLTAKLGGPELMRKMVEPGVLTSGRRIDYAAGLSLWRSRGLPTVSHAGDWAGYTAHFLRFPEQRYAAAALCNSSDATPSALTAALAEKNLSSQMQGVSEPRGLVLLRERGGGVRPSALPAGLYRNAETAAYVQLAVDGGNARLQSGEVTSPLNEAAPGVFHAPEFGRMYAVFERASGSRPAQIVMQDSPQPYVYELVRAWQPADLAAYAGNYSSSEGQARYEISERDGSLVLQAGAATLKLSPKATGEFEGEGLLGEGEAFTLRFEKHAAQDGFLLFVGGVRGLQFSRER